MNTIDLVKTCKQAPAKVERRGAVRRLAERGMTTAEYAVGILAAAALALVLLKVFTNNSFLDGLLKFVVSLIAKIGQMLP